MPTPNSNGETVLLELTRFPDGTAELSAEADSGSVAKELAHLERWLTVYGELEAAEVSALLSTAERL